MDKHLVELIRQTEQYTGDLAERMHGGGASSFGGLVTSKQIVPPHRSQTEQQTRVCERQRSLDHIYSIVLSC